MIDKGQWREFGQGTGVTPLLFTGSAMGFLITTESQDLGLTSHPKDGYFKQQCQASEKYVNFYALNTWLGLLLHELLHQCGVAWRTISPVALLRCNGSPGCFDSGLQVICIVGSGVSHLLLDNTPEILYGVQVRRVCWSIKHSNTMVIELAFGTFGSVAGAKSCWKMKSASP